MSHKMFVCQAFSELEADGDDSMNKEALTLKKELKFY